MAKKSPLVEAVKKVTPAVVSIIITKNHPQSDVPPSMDPFFPFGYDPFYPFGPEHPKQPRPEGPMKIGGGSGFLIDPDGLVLTNRHVVMDADAEYTVVLSSDQKYPATVVAHDPINDVAVLKIPASGLPTIKLGDSSKLELGEEVIAVGNALGQFQNTVSRGIVSGLSRYITASSGLEGKAEQLRGLIQTDAAINPGNSGGPLLNLDGEAIGINAAIVFGAENIGFAIPINAAKKDLADIAKFGRIRQPSLGVRYILVDEELQKRYKLPISSGALVIREAAPEDFAVIPGSAADLAGVKENDVILECNGQKITEKISLQDIVQKLKIGDEIALKVLREGKEIMLNATLQERK